MKQLIIILSFFISACGVAQPNQVINPNGTTVYPFGLSLYAKGQRDLDAKRLYIDPTTKKSRPFTGTPEVLTAIALEDRVQGLKVVINSTGTLNSNGTISGGELEEWWFDASLTLVPYPGLFPRLPAPILSGTMNGATVTLTWPEIDEGYSFQVQRSPNTSFSNPVRIHNDRPRTVSYTGASGEVVSFRARAQGFERRNSPWSNILTYTLNGPPTTLGTPNPFTVTSTDNTNISLQWGAVANAGNYELSYATSSDFSANPSSTFTLPNSPTTITMSSLTPATHYYFKLRATATGYTAGNYAYTDGTTTTPQVSQLDAPSPFYTNNATTNSLQAVWGGVNGAENYNIDISDNSSFSNILATHKVASSITAYTFNSLTSGTNYFFRVNAEAPGYTTSPYATTTGTTLTEAPQDYTVRYWYMSTNPYKDNTSVPFSTGATIMTIQQTPNSDISFNWPAAGRDMFLVWEVPEGQPLKTRYTNGPLNSGNIGNQYGVIRTPFTVNGKTYYVTQDDAGFGYDNNIAITLQ